MLNLPLRYLILLLSLPAWVDATVYQWQDATGHKYFSDRTHSDAKILNIKSGYDFFKIKTVYDGDTVVLENGRKIRLLGINTPEVQHRNQPADAGGEEAKAWLINKLHGTRVRLEGDVEKTDKYGRTLAHLFTEKKQHINVLLVQAGLATTSIYPPNLRYVHELVAAENKAEQERLGLWQRPEYVPIAINTLTDAGHSGWTRLIGQVQTIRLTPKSIYLVFSSRFEVRIDRQWQSLFTNLDSYVGKTVEVRGWLSKNKQHFSLFIRHPSALKLVK